MNISKVSILFFLSLNLGSFAQKGYNYKYLFTAHTYMGESTIDTRLVELDKSGYDNIWLGGDICSETLISKSNMDYLNEQLRIGEPHNYFTLGNHDRRNGNLEYFEKFIGKKSYYADYYNGITTIVLDTNLDPSDCENLNNQFKMICNVTDTISKSSHLILLFHWGLWSGIPGLPDPIIYAHTNLIYWNANCDSTNNNFSQMIYPQLVDVKNRGVKVICIMGDMGASYKKVDMRSDDGIIFLGCGLYNIVYSGDEDEWRTKEKDVILEFNHNVANKSLTWNFRDLDSMINVQHGFTYLTKLSFNQPGLFPADNLIYISNENYMYSLSNTNEDIIILDSLLQNLHVSKNKVFFTGVLKSSVIGGQIKIIYRLKSESDILEENEITITDLQNKLVFYEKILEFATDIQSGYKLEILIKNTGNTSVLLNNIELKYIMH